MNKAYLTALWLVIVAITKKILKYVSLPFLGIWIVLKWLYVLIAGLVALVIVFIVSLLKGKWRV